MCERVGGGALACSRHGRDELGATCSLWSTAWKCSRAGQGVAMDGGLPPGHGG